MKKQASKDSETKSGFVAIIGPANAGKSTLLNKILGQKVSIVSRKQQSTRNRVLGVKTHGNSQIVFFDTPGFLKKSVKGELSKYLIEALESSVTEADSVLLVIDAIKATKDKHFVSNLVSFLKTKSIKTPRIIALNKIDELKKEVLLPLIAQLDEAFKADSIHLIPISAINGRGVNELIDLVCSELPQGPWYFPEDVVSDQSEQFLTSEIIREALFERVHQELPYSSAIRIVSWEETPKRLHISAEILVEKESQKGIVIGKRGATLKGIGSTARISLEKRFRIPVYLELFVKVESQWTQSRKGLLKVGLPGY